VAIAATLNTGTWEVQGCNSSTKGYAMGGYDGDYKNEIEDLNFSDETSVAIAATLNTAKYGGCCVQSGSV
jgi:hypothetical protein